MVKTDHDYVRTLRHAALKQVVNDLVQERIKGTSGRTKRDSYKAKLKGLEVMGVLITKVALYQKVTRQYKKTQQALAAGDGGEGGDECPVEEVDVEHASDVSSLPSAPALPPAPPAPSEKPELPKGDGASPKGKKRKKKGEISESKKRRKECIRAIAEAYSAEKATREAAGKRVQRGFLAKLIEMKKVEFDAPGLRIPEETVRSRAKRGNGKDAADAAKREAAGDVPPEEKAARKRLAAARARTSKATMMMMDAQALAARAEEARGAARQLAEAAALKGGEAENLARHAEKKRGEAQSLLQRSQKEAARAQRFLDGGGDLRKKKPEADPGAILAEAAGEDVNVEEIVDQTDLVYTKAGVFEGFAL